MLHLGNGCSASAVRGGVAVEASMGLTPLQGLVMGTRSGDVDPGLHTFLHNELGLSIGDIDNLLNKQSGLKGLAGVNDFRELEQRRAAGDEAAQLAFDVYVHRLKHYVGAYLALLGSLDVLTFTAGVGENNPALRAAVVDGLDGLGLTVDPARNETPSRDARVISPDGSPVTVAVVPTNEELAIARRRHRCPRSSALSWSIAPRVRGQSDQLVHRPHRARCAVHRFRGARSTGSVDPHPPDVQTRKTISVELTRLADLQAGVVTIEQAVGLGQTRHSLGRLVGSGQWHRLAPGLYLTLPVAADFSALAWGGVLLGGDGSRLGPRASGHLHQPVGQRSRSGRCAGAG